MTRVEWADQSYDADILDADEQKALWRHVFDYLAAGNSFLLETFKLNQQGILAAASVAKEKLDEPFKGILAGDNEIGVQLVRPGHILRTTDTTETPTNDWTFTFTNAGDYWIGYSTNNTTAINISQYLTLLVVGVEWTQGSQPRVEELYWQVGRNLYPIEVIRHAWVADNPNNIRAARFHPKLLAPRETVLVQTYSLGGHTAELVPLGLAFAPGRYLRKTSYAAADLP